MRFTIDIETTENTSLDEETIDDVAVGLERTAVVDPVASINTRTGVVAATFQIDAANMEEAVREAIAAFTRALLAAGIESEAGLLAAEEVASVTVASTPARELAGV